jgi:hypothetical protein
MTFKTIESAVRKLSVKEQSKLAATLLATLDANEPAEQLWIEEAERRYKAYRANRTIAQPWSAAIVAAKAALRR